MNTSPHSGMKVMCLGFGVSIKMFNVHKLQLSILHLKMYSIPKKLSHECKDTHTHTHTNTHCNTNCGEKSIMDTLTVYSICLDLCREKTTLKYAHNSTSVKTGIIGKFHLLNYIINIKKRVEYF